MTMRKIVFVCFLTACTPLLMPAQSSRANTSSDSILDKFMTAPGTNTGSWTQEQIAMMGRLRDAAMTDPYAFEQLTHLTNVIGPRLTGSPQASAAVEWVAAEMRSLGATVTLEKTSVPRWIRGDETAMLTSWPGMVPGTTQKIVLTALGNSVATPTQGLTAQVTVVNSFTDLKGLSPEKVNGRIVLFDRPFDKELTAEGQGLNAYIEDAPYRLLGASAAASMGAAAVLVRSLGSADLRLPHTGNVVYTSTASKIPAAAVTAEDAALLARLAKNGPVIMRLTLTPRTLPAAISYNVIADWKGSVHPEEVVIVSGHLDSWDLGTGATDDGAGVVMAMETIQLLHSLELHPRRTVRLIAWMNEENSATGAATYATDHASQVGQHIAAIESDTGCDHPTGLLFSGSPVLANYLAPVGLVLQPINAGVISRTENLPSEDVAPLVKAGVPGLTPAQDLRHYFDYHHTAADTLDKVDKHLLAENAAVIAVTAYALADASTPAPRIR